MDPNAPLPLPSDEVALYQFKKILSVLSNDQGIITSIAQLAVANVAHADLYVEIISSELAEATQPDKRLLVLYVIDMIVKLDVTRIYMQCLTPFISNVFLTIYSDANETVRNALWQLFLTWSGVFPLETLNQIRMGMTMISQGYRGSAAFSINNSGSYNKTMQPTVIPVSYESQQSIPINVSTQHNVNISNPSFTPVTRYQQPMKQNTQRYSSDMGNTNVTFGNIETKDEEKSLPPSTDPEYIDNENLMESEANSISIPIETQASQPTNIPIYSFKSQTTTPTYQTQREQRKSQKGKSEQAIGKMCPICGCKFVDMERHMKYHQVLSACGGLQSQQQNSWDAFRQQKSQQQQNTYQTYCCSICGRPLTVFTTQDGQIYFKDCVMDQQGQFAHQQCLMSMTYQ
ncbi:hypothetical protein EIN_372070 [Entamoeba invadens IP1]|uniref:CID domain-containing protein n=1 Tax=Entamoeba invadens IP1 TaxID=370355 RepID=A0A0A1UC23_ENTIV|nr:hypothetical protein EIN_372070 [Entamoeba invadens IP1]ELP92785.1 hypothetical protein EIN_372070 [Entamoeba invadens IP1]|eukprot:XP_004259556.1 hypothetical protein EIN_372070 [Entamoeba invadens IP1]